MPRARTFLIIGSVAWCASIVAAPLFHTPFIYEFFSRICHQNPTRSLYLFGEPLAVCIRCSAIYFGFLAGLLLGVRPSPRALRFALAATVVELFFALFVIDSAMLRAVSGIALGATAAPFVNIGVEQLLKRTPLKRVLNDSM